MKGLYYHPKRIKEYGSPIMVDGGKHEAVYLFVNLIQELAPEVLDDLETRAYDAYAEAERWFHEQGGLSNVWEVPSNWDLVEKADSNFFSGYIGLKNAINDWANKFNLNGQTDLYKELALWSIGNYYDDKQETSRKQRLEDIKRYAEMFEVPEEACRAMQIYQFTWPYEEKLTLSKNLSFEDESDDIALSESIGEDERIHHSFFSRIFPFAFTPDPILYFYNGQPSDNAYGYEALRLYDHRKTRFIEQAKTQDLSEYEMLTQPWEGGIGWDPRMHTWREFEEELDKYYETYKKLYRERTERFLEERGYVKEREKRNLDHFKWLVHYQAQGWSLREIADHYSSSEVLTEDAVFHGLRNTADLVLIKLRSRAKQAK